VIQALDCAYSVALDACPHARFFRLWRIGFGCFLGNPKNHIRVGFAWPWCELSVDVRVWRRRLTNGPRFAHIKNRPGLAHVEQRLRGRTHGATP
jgi:hypothetical protein